MEAEDFADLHSIMDEGVTVLHNAEFTSFKEAAILMDQFLLEQQAQQEAVKVDIIAMQQTCTEEENLIEAEKQRLNDVDMISVTKKYQEVQERQNVLNQELAQMKLEQRTDSSKKEEMERKLDDLKNTTTKVLPVIRHDINLYKYISGIRWQYGGPSNEVNGYISSKKTIKTFSFDKQLNSQFFIANYLRENIDCEDW